MKIAAHIAAGLLTLIFLLASIPMLFHLMQMPPLKEGTAEAMFFGAFGPTGYFTFIKTLELIGAILVSIPLTRNIALLILGPIIVNVLAFCIFIKGGEGLINPMIIVMCLAAAFLLYVERRAFAGLVFRSDSNSL